MPSARMPRGSRLHFALAAALPLLTAAFLPSASRADDASWPRQFDSSSGTFVIYELQPESLEGDVLSGRAAFSLQKPGDALPVFGVLWLTTRVEIDRDSSTVTQRDLDITKVRLPQITPDEAARYEKLVEREAARWDLSGSLEELRSGLAAAEKERASVDDIQNDPPRIVFAHERAILVQYDGPPALAPIEDSNLEYATNTPYAVVFDPRAQRYYLNGANLWYAARDPLGPWSPIEVPPAAVRDVVPPDTTATDALAGAPPEVLTATEPTELIATDGPPRYLPLIDDRLLYVSNTESDVLRDLDSQDLYVLLAGRWYAARTEDGPWAYVPGNQLPETFRQIPPDSPRGSVLASIPGTDQADDAVADAEIPQTSAARRDDASFAPAYDGPPDFQPIAGTDLRYAVNCNAEVIFADGRYYACDQGVWYIADDPNGPWSVSETRPLELEDVPPSCPVYDCRYVYIYSYTPEVVYVGYLPGYVGCYPHQGTVVYGTGYHYPPWRGRRRYFPRPWTWGFQARYNPWLSRWSFGSSYATGFLRVGSRWHPDVRKAPRVERAMWFGAGGYRRPLVARDLTLLRSRPPGRSRPAVLSGLPSNLYNRQENLARVDRSAIRVPVRPLPRPAAQVARQPNNVFAGRDGKVYRRDNSGAWKVNNGRGWRPTPAPVVPVGALQPNTRGNAPGAPARRTWPSAPQFRQPAPMPVQPNAPESPRPTPAPQPPRPAPVQPNAPGNPRPAPTPPVMERTPRPAPAPVSPTPGNLEREYRARERAGKGSTPPAPAPANEPRREGKN